MEYYLIQRQCLLKYKYKNIIFQTQKTNMRQIAKKKGTLQHI